MEISTQSEMERKGKTWSERTKQEGHQGV